MDTYVECCKAVTLCYLSVKRQLLTVCKMQTATVIYLKVVNRWAVDVKWLPPATMLECPVLKYLQYYHMHLHDITNHSFVNIGMTRHISFFLLIGQITL